MVLDAQDTRTSCAHKKIVQVRDVKVQMYPKYQTTTHDWQGRSLSAMDLIFLHGQGLQFTLLSKQFVLFIVQSEEPDINR